jgi:glycosyltransferase involved in cell wall biosynthesis
VVRLTPNQGKGAALRAGFRRALEDGCAAVVTLDADGQHNPDEIPRFVAAYDAPGASGPRPELIIAVATSPDAAVRRLSNSLGTGPGLGPAHPRQPAGQYPRPPADDGQARKHRDGLRVRGRDDRRLPAQWLDAVRCRSRRSMPAPTREAGAHFRYSSGRRGLPADADGAGLGSALATDGWQGEPVMPALICIDGK